MSRLLEIIGKPDVTISPVSRLKTIRRRYKVKGRFTNLNDLPVGIVLPWGTPDEELPTAVLEDQGIEGVKENPDADISYIFRVYQEATGELQPISGLSYEVDENDRRTGYRDYIILKSAPKTAREGDLGLTHDPENALMVLDKESHSEGNAVVKVRRFFVEATDELQQVGRNSLTYNETGLLRLDQSFVAIRGVSHGVQSIGVDTLVVNGVTLYLAGVQTKHSEATIRVTRVWVEPGILDAEKQFTKDGLLYVTFVSQGIKFVPTALKSGAQITDWILDAFQGGDEAILFKDRARNVSGLRQYVITVMMNADGSPLNPAADNEISNHQMWVRYTRPGEIIISPSAGTIAHPSVDRHVKVNVRVILSTTPTLDGATRPFSVEKWANYYAAWTPEETGVRVHVAKGANGYLADSAGVGTNTTFWGEEVSSYMYNAGSIPTPDQFLAIENAILGAEHEPTFITDTGQRWYRRVQVELVGSMGDYFSTV